MYLNAEIALFSTLQTAFSLRALNVAMRVLAVYLPYVIVLLALILVLRGSYTRKQLIFFGVFIAFAVLLANGLITHTLHVLVPRLRPFAELSFEPLAGGGGTGNALPAAHAALLFTLGFGAFFFNRGVGWLLLATALLNGIGLVYCGLHWPTDIVAGAAAAGLAVGAAYLLVWKPARIY